MHEAGPWVVLQERDKVLSAPHDVHVGQPGWQEGLDDFNGFVVQTVHVGGMIFNLSGGSGVVLKNKNPNRFFYHGRSLVAVDCQIAQSSTSILFSHR